jgi:hypothetical protein
MIYPFAPTVNGLSPFARAGMRGGARRGVVTTMVRGAVTSVVRGEDGVVTGRILPAI